MDKVGVVGCGLMGSGIAEVTARAGLDVVVVESSPSAADAGRSRLAKSLERAEGRGKLDGATAQEVLARINVTTDMDLLADRDLVVEAIIENIDIKLKLFGELGAILPAHSLICSNTSSISITRLAAATNRPEKFMGMHFMNPVPVMKLVEVIRGLEVAEVRQDLAGIPRTVLLRRR